MTEVDRPDPEDDPFACSKCGTYIGTMKRHRGDDYCDGCQRELGLKPPLRVCIDCRRRAPQEEMHAIDTSHPADYYPQIKYLCRSCADTETGGDA